MYTFRKGRVLKIIYISLFVIFGLSACATHNVAYYDRANNASEKSLDGLDRDTK